MAITKDFIEGLIVTIQNVQFGILKLVKDLFKGDLGWTFYIS